jgi:hypothetical protein
MNHPDSVSAFQAIAAAAKPCGQRRTRFQPGPGSRDRHRGEQAGEPYPGDHSCHGAERRTGAHRLPARDQHTQGQGEQREVGEPEPYG